MTDAGSGRSTPPTPSSNDRSSLPTTASTTTLPGGPTTRSRSQSQAAMATRPRDDGEAVRVTVTPRNPLPPTPETHSPDDPSSATTPTRVSRKRAHSIDIEEANQARIRDLRLYTPNTARSTTSEGPRELICLCTKAPKVPRPRNAFILYRQHFQGQVAARHPGLANPEISKLIGEQWREQPEEVKNNWKRLAEEEKIRHQRQYPDYRYQPRRGGKTASGRPISAPGEDPGHCPKCGGRYIATPRTPSTPFSAATPLPPNPGSNMPPYVTPNPRVIETDHLRRGSTSSTMSVDAHGRRYTQAHLQNIDEDYPAMSPMAAPVDTKRRRFNGPNIFVPGSPLMGYVPVDPRFQQQPPMNGPPVSATGYGPGPLPRPGVQYHQPPYSNHPHMQPPPRPSMAYQPAPTPTRSSAGFDESLRLPPLQTQIPGSPGANSEAGTQRAISAAAPGPSTGLGIVNGPSSLPRKSQHRPLRWSFLFKLDVLREISQPLMPPGPGGPVFETRGPLIAIEGATPTILKEVASVVENALSVSGEYVVKMWTDDTQTQPNTGESGGGSNDSSEGRELGESNPPKRPEFMSPLAAYVARMLKWHKTSGDLIRYITSHPPPPRMGDSEAGENVKVAEDASSKPNNRLPVAVVADGYSLTVSDRWADSLPANDIYAADDHWQWVATLWRGIVAADLTVYVKRVPEAEVQGNNCVEFANPAVMVVRMADGRGMDEKVERRLGFEIIEWVRSGSFKAGFTIRS
ncbi:slightly ste11-like protein [Parahypoxylon ruwenzoriense]